MKSCIQLFNVTKKGIQNNSIRIQIVYEQYLYQNKAEVPKLCLLTIIQVVKVARTDKQLFHSVYSHLWLLTNSSG